MAAAAEAAAAAVVAAVTAAVAVAAAVAVGAAVTVSVGGFTISQSTSTTRRHQNAQPQFQKQGVRKHHLHQWRKHLEGAGHAWGARYAEKRILKEATNMAGTASKARLNAMMERTRRK